MFSSKLDFEISMTRDFQAPLLLQRGGETWLEIFSQEELFWGMRADLQNNFHGVN